MRSVEEDPALDWYGGIGRAAGQEDAEFRACDVERLNRARAVTQRNLRYGARKRWSADDADIALDGHSDCGDRELRDFETDGVVRLDAEGAGEVDYSVAVGGVGV